MALLVAAGSLQSVMDELVSAYRAQGGTAFTTRYGPSGKLCREIEAGAVVDVFASASMAHTEALAAKYLMGPSRMFAYNELCVVGYPQAALCEEKILDFLANPSVRVATSTPVSDPMGDYTWEFFRRADKARPGFLSVLDAKAIKLSGAAMPESGEAYAPYVAAFAQGRADVYIMYRTNALVVRRTLPELVIVSLPQDCRICCEYGIAANHNSTQGETFVQFAMSDVAQQILQRHGFGKESALP